MTDRDRAILRTDAALDQAWCEMADNLGELQKLLILAFAARETSPTGNLLVSALGLVCAECYQRSAKARELDGEEQT